MYCADKSRAWEDGLFFFFPEILLTKKGKILKGIIARLKEHVFVLALASVTLLN